jgi:phenylacetate-CoA ligase
VIVGLVDWIMRLFEWRASSPTAVSAAARLFDLALRRGLNTPRVASIQTRRLRHTLQYAGRWSPHYREVFQKADFHPGAVRSTAALRRLPFTTATDIRDWRRFLCVPEAECAAVFTTSGTAGEPKRLYFTYRELQALSNFAALALRFRNPGRLVALIVLPTSHGLWIGSATAQRAVERAGGLPLSVGADDPGETLAWMERFEPNVVISSPSCMSALTRRAERAGFRRSLDRILVSGEFCSPAQKQAFSDYWGAQVLDSYGSTETGGGQTLALSGCGAMHLNDLHLVTEIVDPDTGEPAEEGELVFTTLLREAMPLVRYRSGDRGRWSACPCGLPFRAVEVAGRTDDMFVAGDMNLYGNVIANAVARVNGASGRMAILLDRVDLTDRMVLRVEGSGVEDEAVRQALFTAYPELRTNTANENLILEIDPNVNLGSQAKGFKVVDRRAAMSAGGTAATVRART